MRGMLSSFLVCLHKCILNKVPPFRCPGSSEMANLNMFLADNIPVVLLCHI